MTKTNLKSKGSRATELDVIRGFAILLMFGHHIMYDIHYIFDYPYFSWLFGPVMESIYHPLIYILFLGVAGVSSVFSRNNFKRAARLALIALGLTVISSLISVVLTLELYIFWQVIHCLAICTLLNGILDKIQVREKFKIVILILLGFVILFYLPGIINAFNLTSTGSPFLLPLGIGYLRAEVPGMLDYLPLIPYSGCFFIGVALGKIIYPQGELKKQNNVERTLANPLEQKNDDILQTVPEQNNKRFITKFVSIIFKPLAFLGRHALVVYAIHQPIFIALIWLVGLVF